MDASHPWESRQDILVNALKVPSAFDFDLQDIVRSARHQKALLNFRVLSDRGLESVEVFLGLAVERDVDDHGQGIVAVNIADQRGIAADVPGLFKLGDPAKAG